MKSRRVFVAFALCFAVILGAPTRVFGQAVLAVNDVQPPAAVTVPAGTPIVVELAGGPGNPTDWIGFFPAGAGDDAYQAWRYLSGTTTPPAAGLSSATITFPAPAMPGDYDVRLFANDGFTRLASSSTITITPSPASLIVNGVAPPTIVSTTIGTTVTVGLINGPANASDWIGLFAIGAADTSYLSWRYLNGTTSLPAAGTPSASVAFPVPTTIGDYEFRLFANDGFLRLTTSTTLHVTLGAAQLTVNGAAPPAPVTIAPGSMAAVAVSGGPANQTDWVGLYAQGAADTAYLAWKYLNDATAPPSPGVAAATLHFLAPAAPGAYEFRLFVNNGFARIATSAPVAVPPSPSQVSVNGVVAPATVTVQPSATVSVLVTNGPGNTTDWIGLAAAGTPDTSYLAWQYLNGSTAPPPSGVTSATLTFAAPATPGTYEFRLFANNGFIRLTTGPAVVVSTATGTCLTVSPASVSIGAPGGSGTLNVTGDAACAWTASSDSSWVALGGIGGPYRATIAAAGAVGHWRFNEQSGTAAADASGHGLDGTINDGVTFQPGGALADGDGSAAFDGSTGRVRVPASPLLDFGTGLTIETWIRTSTNRWQRIVGKGPVYTQWELFVTDTGQIAPMMLSDTNFAFFYGNAVVTDDHWHHVAAAWDGALLSLYVDGVLDSTSPFDGQLIVDSTAPLFIGVDQYGYPLKGSLDEVALYDHALTAEEVAAHYAAASAQPDPHGSGAVVYTVAPNESAAARHATLTVAGQPIAVTQAGVATTCSFTLSIAGVSAGWDGASAQFTVTAPAGCAWNAASDAAWIGVTPASGTGTSTLTYRAEFNLSAEARSSALHVGGESVSVSQDGAPACAYSVSPDAVTAPATGASGSLTVATRFGCETPAASNVPWITVTGGGVGGYASVILGDHPDAYWRLGESSGSTAVDATGYGQDAQYAGAYTLGAGAAGDGNTAVAFDGGYAGVYGLVYGGPYTVEAWVKARSGASGSVVSQWDAPGIGFSLDLAGGHPRFHADYGLDAPQLYAIDGTAAIDDGSWHHLAASFDDSELTASLYVDGALQATTPANPDVGQGFGSMFVIGAHDSGFGGYLHGAIDEVALYRRVLSAAQIAAHAAARTAPPANPATVTFDRAYSVAPTIFAVSRSGAIAVGDQIVPVTQTGRSCDSITVTPPSATADGLGGSGSVAVAGTPGCALSATTNDDWLTLSTTTGYAGTVLSDGAAGYWRLGEASGTIASDASGNGHDGTYLGDGYTQGIGGAMPDNSAVAFTGQSGSVQVAEMPNPDPEGPYTVEAWVKYSDSSYGWLAQHGNYVLQLNGPNVIWADMGGEGNLWSIRGTRALNDDTWHHIVGVSDPGANAARLYVDGELDVTDQIQQAWNYGGQLNIGLYTTSSVDEVAVYRLPLTGEQIARHFAMRDFATGGSGRVVFTAAPNPTIEPRTGSFSVNGVVVPVVQAGRPCTSVSPSNLVVDYTAQTQPVHVSALVQTCGWTASATDPWIELSGTPGTGTGDVMLAIAENTTWFTRTTTLTVAGESVTVTQHGTPAPPEAYPTAITDSEIDASTLDFTNLTVDATDPLGGTPQIQWTQIDGPPVTLSGTTTNRIGFMTPEAETDLTFRVTVTNAVGTTTSDVVIHALGLATRMGLTADTGAAHTSTIKVSSTSLRSGYLFGSTDTTFNVSLDSSGGATLDTAGVEILMANDDGDQDVSSMFVTTGSSLSLMASDSDAFRGLLPDEPTALRISGFDTVGASVDLSVPIGAAKYQILGTATLPQYMSGPLPTTLVLLKGLTTDYRALTFLGADMTFGFGNVPADKYTVWVLAPQAVTGSAYVDATASPTTKNVTVPLNAHVYTLDIPPGTKYLAIAVGAAAGAGFGHDYYFTDHPDAHPCVLSGLPWYQGGTPVEDTPYGFTFLLNGEVVGSGSGSFCGTPVAGFNWGTVYSDILDVSGLTANGYAFLQGVLDVTHLLPGSDVWGNYVIGAAPLDKAFVATSVKDVKGVNERGKLWEDGKRKIIGVPKTDSATFNTFGIDVRYTPAAAQIQSVRATAIGAVFGREDLAFSQPFSSGNGLLTLRNVGFAANGTGHRDPAGPHDDDMRIELTIQALLPGDTDPVTATVYLGKNAATHVTSVILTPLSKAGDIPGVLRYGTNHEENIGGDSWGTAPATELIKQFPSLIIFNDLSVEHGGKFPPRDHTLHKVGRSIDARFPGPGGEGNPLNGSNPDLRQTRWAQAQAGNVDALREMVTWLRTVRSNTDQILGSPLVNFIYVDPAAWHRLPMLFGTFADGTPIVDPDTHQPIGQWRSHDSKVHTALPHLDHFHIEMKPRSSLRP